ncbi:MAG: alpha/beta hydrolase [Solirubrobacterales bacterium]
MPRELPHDELGEGPALVLLHAGIADRRMWDEHLEPLAASGHRAVAVDLPGFGEAPIGAGPVAHWEDVVATMDALGIARAALAGSSFGGAVALRLAATHPRRVSSLALFSSPTVPDAEPSPELAAIWEREEAALAAGDLDAAVAAIVSGWIPASASAEIRDRIASAQRRNYERHGAAEEPEWAPDPFDQDPSLAAAIEVPALLAAGELDLPDFRDAAGDLAAKLPRGRQTVIAGCAHLAPLEAPERFRELLLEHLGA